MVAETGRRHKIYSPEVIGNFEPLDVGVGNGICAL